MQDERPRRRRRRRGRRGGGRAAAERSPDGASRPPEWRWRTFPVAFAFALGSLIAAVLIAGGLFYPVLYLALFGVSFGLAHMIVRRMRRG